MTQDKVASLFKTASDEVIEDFVYMFNRYGKLFGLNSTVQENFFLAEIREEVGPTLESRRENLNYSCKALRKIFRYYKRNPKSSKRDGRCSGHRANQRKIANKIYANRIGNGDISSGDGYRFRGGGTLQITGRGNYQDIADVLSERLNANITVFDVETEITQTGMGVLSAMAFWYSRGLHKLDHIDKITRKINRYTDSYQKRKGYYLYLAKNFS